MLAAHMLMAQKQARLIYGYNLMDVVHACNINGWLSHIDGYKIT